MIKIAINGFGRIGRVVFRKALAAADVEIVGINDLAPVDASIHLLKYDSVHGRIKANVKKVDGGIEADGKFIPVFSTKDPKEAAVFFKNADVVMECSGALKGDDLKLFLGQGGVKPYYVVVSRPEKVKGEFDNMIVMGVNHTKFNPDKDKVVSNASCTTNCLAPFAKVLHEKFGIVEGLMTTIHAYTNDQNILDMVHKDFRRARAGALSMIPTTTGAARAVGKVIPELNGKLDGFAIRVPTPNVSVVDLTVILEKPATAAEINAEFKRASENELKGILGYEDEELVSMDFNGCELSSIIDSKLTKTLENGKQVKVISWYDNETGYSVRMIDLARYMMSKTK